MVGILILKKFINVTEKYFCIAFTFFLQQGKFFCMNLVISKAIMYCWYCRVIALLLFYCKIQRCLQYSEVALPPMSFIYIILFTEKI